MPALAPRPYQIDALRAITDAEARGLRRPLVAHPTASGKTVTFTHLIARRGPRAVVLCHRDELVRQATNKIRIVAPELRVGVVKAGEDETDADVVVASVQTLAHPARLARLGSGFTTVVVDEAHHATAPSWQRTLRHLGSFEAGGPLTVGFTATPERGDGQGLGQVWQQVVHQVGILEMITAGYLSDLRGQVVGTDADFSAVHVRHGDLAESELAAELARSGALGEIAGAYVRYAASRKGVAFTPDVATAHTLAAELRLRGITAETVHGGQPVEERRAVLARLRTGQTRVVTNCAVLTEGFDEPSIDCVVIARPTRSHPLFVQMVGRGTRRYPGKTDCLVLDVSGASLRHDLVTLADLAGIPRTALTDGMSLSQAAAEHHARGEAEVERAFTSGAVDLFRSALRWLPVGEAFCLSAGEHIVILAPHETGWRLVLADRRGTEVAAEGLDLAYAQGVGEDFARAEGAVLARRDANWRRLPATARQLGLLAALGLRDRDRVTSRGQAADLITQIKARTALRHLTGARR